MHRASVLRRGLNSLINTKPLRVLEIIKKNFGISSYELTGNDILPRLKLIDLRSPNIFNIVDPQNRSRE